MSEVDRGNPRQSTSVAFRTPPHLIASLLDYMGSMPSTPAKAASNKRSAEEQPVAHQPSVRRRRTNDLATSPQRALVQLQQPPNAALQSAEALAAFSHAVQLRSQRAQDGAVSLSREEVQQLSNNIEATVQSCEFAPLQISSQWRPRRKLMRCFLSTVLHKPATTADMLVLLGEIQRVLPLSSTSQPQITDPALAEAFYTPRRGRRAASHKPALDLPADIIALIVDELRALHAEESDELIWNSTGASSGWKELKRLSHVNRACKPASSKEDRAGGLS